MKPQLQSRINEHDFRQILGIRFFVGCAQAAVEIGSQRALVVVPAAPALLELERDVDYRRALLGSDLAITDSGYMVILWKLLMGERISRVSGLEYLRLLLQRPEFREPGTTMWVMPSGVARERTFKWLEARGFPSEPGDFYVAPKYRPADITDPELVRRIDERKPRHIVVGIGGGTQEKLGLYLKENCDCRPSIHCIGAAIGFLTGDQVRIPVWGDRWILGWFFRCLVDPKRFVPRYFKAVRLATVLWRYRSQMPDLRPLPTGQQPQPGQEHPMKPTSPGVGAPK